MHINREKQLFCQGETYVTANIQGFGRFLSRIMTCLAAGWIAFGCFLGRTLTSDPDLRLILVQVILSILTVSVCLVPPIFEAMKHCKFVKPRHKGAMKPRETPVVDSNYNAPMEVADTKYALKLPKTELFP
jgi:hypothetical protein